jgi:DNA-3-methyladenine glycosylase II
MNRFPDLADEDIIEELVKLRGIGRWTAEMLLIFTLGRQNVLSVGDLGIKNGLKLLYGDNPDCEAIKAKFSPHLTALSLYLWEIAGNPKAYFSQE